MCTEIVYIAASVDIKSIYKKSEMHHMDEKYNEWKPDFT